MNKKLHTINWVLSFLLLSGSWALAQDIHWSQFGNSSLNLSPGLTGIHRGDVRFATNYRNQWKNVPVDYLTFSGSMDKKFLSKHNPNGFISGGLLFTYDRAGDAKLSWAKVGLSGSYTQTLNAKNFLTGGLQLALNQRRFKVEGLRFDNQWDGEVFNPALGSRETFDNTSIGFFDFSAGLNYRFQSPVDPRVPRHSQFSPDQKDRHRLDLGISLHHINRPAQNFYDEEAQELTPRWSVYGMGVLGLTAKLDLLVLALGHFQDPHREIVLGTGVHIHLNQDFGKETGLRLGLSHRAGDAWIPSIELHYRQWLVGLSYDINTSGFNRATDYRGGPEISLIHVITRPKSLEFKICPLL